MGNSHFVECVIEFDDPQLLLRLALAFYSSFKSYESVPSIEPACKVLTKYHDSNPQDIEDISSSATSETLSPPQWPIDIDCIDDTPYLELSSNSRGFGYLKNYRLSESSRPVDVDNTPAS